MFEWIPYFKNAKKFLKVIFYSEHIPMKEDLGFTMP